MKPTVPEVFRKGVDLLEAEGVPFVVVGGIAASLQGEPRYTDDVDFMVTLPTSRVQSLVEKARAEGFDIEPELAETQWHFGGCVRLWIGEPGSQTAMDLMACKTDFMKEAAWRAVPVRCMGRLVPVASAEDMVLFKIVAWRIQDAADAQKLVARHRDRLDVAYLRKWASWFAGRNPTLKEVPARLEALLDGKPLPPSTG